MRYGLSQFKKDDHAARERSLGQMIRYGIRVLVKGSWKNDKLRSFNLENLQLESFYLSLKEPSEIGKIERSWKVPIDFIDSF